MPDKPFDPIATRHSLLARLKDWGDQASWQDFFDTYWQLIYNVAIKAGLTDAEAQEVVQETVIAVARKIPEFKTDPAHGSFSAWLMHLTRWRIADQFRKRQKLGVQASACPSGALERVKCQVSPRQFQMFDLHVLQKLSVQETARTLQASVASVYMAKHRVGPLARKELTKLEKSQRERGQ
jgi:RNA polymerase sigma-70 factor (ECF subfamily)